MSARKSRLRWAGKPATAEEIKENVLSLIRTGHGDTEIAAIGAKERTQIYRYKQELINEGKLTKTDTGRIELTPEAKSLKEYRELQVNEFINEFECVEKWTKDMQGRKAGKGMKTWKRGNLSAFKAVIDTLKVSPCVFHENKIEDIEEFVRNFTLEYKKTHPTVKSFRRHILAIRSFCGKNGITWSRGGSDLMSGKKDNFGVYSNVQLTDSQITNGLRIAVHEMHDGLLALYFGLSIEDIARASSQRALRAD
ncbi:MAG: hypothetical protein AAB330_02490, partial [Bacteroidota bacterium]